MDLREKRVRSLIENFELASLKYGAHTLFAFERAKVDYEISYKEFYEYACAMTRGFMHLGLGGKRVCRKRCTPFGLDTGRQYRPAGGCQKV